MKHINILSLLFLIALFGNSKAQTYSQPTEVISSGGGETTGGNYSNFAVLGETFVDFSISGGNYNTTIGFLYASDISTGIDETILNNEDIRIFPNPTTNKLIIEMQNRTDVNISIFNAIGQNVYESNVETNNKTIDVTGLQTGIYFVKIKDLKGNILLSEKIIKE